MTILSRPAIITASDDNHISSIIITPSDDNLTVIHPSSFLSDRQSDLIHPSNHPSIIVPVDDSLTVIHPSSLPQMTI
jgi:hypothetical protein